MQPDELLKQAKLVRERAYAPYSSFKVGAAILDSDGQVHVGCNVENLAFPEGTCAEAGAISAMVSRGGESIAQIVILGGTENAEHLTCYPCGGCRQKIMEFSTGATRIGVQTAEGSLRWYSMEALLPAAFEDEFT